MCMKTPLHTNKTTQYTRDGLLLTSASRQAYKKALPPLPQEVFEVAFGMTLGDAGIRRECREAYMKFEQGAKQRDFLFHVFDVLRAYCWMERPGTRYEKADRFKIQSYWFYTFSHPTFTDLFRLFYTPSPDIPHKYTKGIREGLIRDFLTPRALAYWIMCDGYLHKNGKIVTLHTEGFAQQDVERASREVNQKWELHSRVACRRGKYFVIQFSTVDASRLRGLVAPYILECFSYKIPHF